MNFGLKRVKSCEKTKYCMTFYECDIFLHDILCVKSVKVVNGFSSPIQIQIYTERKTSFLCKIKKHWNSTGIKLCSKLAIKIPHPRFWRLYNLLWTDSTYCFDVSITDFEQGKVGWKTKANRQTCAKENKSKVKETQGFFFRYFEKIFTNFANQSLLTCHCAGNLLLILHHCKWHFIFSFWEEINFLFF